MTTAVPFFFRKTYLALIGTIGLYIISEKFRRLTYLWARFIPVVFSYKLLPLKLQGKASIENYNKEFRLLNEYYAPLAYQACVYLGGVYCKIGQFVGCRLDITPEPYYRALCSLSDTTVVPLPFPEIRMRLESNFHSLTDIFTEFEQEPFKVGSLTQIHRATIKGQMRDFFSIEVGFSTSPNPESPSAKQQRQIPVVVKMILPKVRNNLDFDLQNLKLFIHCFLSEEAVCMDEIQRQLTLECNLYREASMQKRIAKSIHEEFPEFIIPRVADYLISADIIVMEYLNGDSLMNAFKTKFSNEECIFWSCRIVQLIGKMILVDGRFHADPHIGNWIVIPASHKAQDNIGHNDIEQGYESNPSLDYFMGLVDFGQVKELNLNARIAFCRLIKLMNESSESIVAAQMRACGFRTRYDLDKSYSFYSTLFFDTLPIKNMNNLVRNFSTKDTLVRIPSEFLLIIRTGFVLRDLLKLLDMNVVSSKELWYKYSKIGLVGYEDASSRPFSRLN